MFLLSFIIFTVVDNRQLIYGFWLRISPIQWIGSGGLLLTIVVLTFDPSYRNFKYVNR